MFQSNSIDDLDDIEQLRIAALQTLHQKKVEPRPQVTPQAGYLENLRSNATFDDPIISPFPGYNPSRIQLSPRSAAFVESNISILKRRKEGLDSNDRWSRSPSPPPKYKSSSKRKSLSPLPPIRRSSPERKHKRPSRSPPGHQHTVRRSSDNHRSSQSSGNVARSRNRSRERHNGHRNSVVTQPSRRLEPARPRTRSKSVSPAPVPRKMAKSERKEEKRQKSVEREEKKEVEAKSEPKVERMEEEEELDSDSSDSDSSSASSAIDLFASESESENEGRFKCSSKPEKNQEKVSFSSKPKNKTDLLDSVLPDGGGEQRERYGDRFGRKGNGHNRPRGMFKASFRELDSGSSDKRDRRGGNRDRESSSHKGGAGSGRNSHSSSSNSRKATSEKL